MKGSEFIDEYWKENKLALGVKDQWGEIMEAYHEAKVESKQRELLKSFCEYIDLKSHAHPDDIKFAIENYINTTKTVIQ